MGKIINVSIPFESDAIGYIGEDTMYHGWCPWDGTYKVYISEEEYEEEYTKYLTARVEELLKRAIRSSRKRRKNDSNRKRRQSDGDHIS